MQAAASADVLDAISSFGAKFASLAQKPAVKKDAVKKAAATKKPAAKQAAKK